MQKLMAHFWKPGEVIASRGIYRKKIWSAIPTIVVRDTPEELVLTLLPGIEAAISGILDRLENHRYPFDGSWLNWRPDPT